MNRGWEKVLIADYYDIRSGLSKPAKDFGSGYPFLSFSDVFWNYFVPENLTQLVKSNEKERVNCSVKKGDVFLTRTSEKIEELGMSCVALKDYENATFNGFTKRLRPKEDNKIDPQFIGFYLRSPQFRAEITAYSTLTTRASLNNDIIGRLKIFLPPLPTQRKIATILSAYDDLIENNLKRIKLLEEMAQLTYEEWFVRMKFPGHEDCPINEETGLPEGWEEGTIGSLTKFLNGFAYKSKRFTNTGFPIIKIKNIGGNTVDTSNTNFIDAEYANATNKFKLQPGDLLIAMTGATVGKVGFVPITDKACYLNQRVGKFMPKEGLNNILFINCFFNTEQGQSHVMNFARGSAQPNISSSQILSIKTVVPPVEVLRLFDDKVRPNSKIILSLIKQNQLLKEARDILLPRLMTGMIDVENIEIASFSPQEMIS